MSSATLPTGPSDARFTTSAAVAETEASNPGLSNQVQQNAGQLHNAAADAATIAEFKEPHSASAVNQLEESLSDRTNAAASQGAVDVQSAKATANSYVEQAKNLAGNVIATAQSYVSGQQPTTKGVGSGVGTTVQSAIETGKEYLVSAQAAAKPYIESATGIAQQQAEKGKNALLGTTSSTGTGSSASGRPSEVPSHTADLESGPHVVSNPYPEPTNGQHKKVAEL